MCMLWHYFPSTVKTKYKKLVTLRKKKIIVLLDKATLYQARSLDLI